MSKRSLNNSPTALDFFCGVGGLSLGVTQSGFRLVGAVDNDQQVLDAHKLNFPSVPVHKCDLYQASGRSIRKALDLGTSVIDLVAGGPPCQGFSVGGTRAKNDPRNHGVLAFARLVSEIRPRYFLMENVHGFLFRDHARYRRRFRMMLEEAGYALQPFRLLNAADFGVPQRRHRCFVVGCLESEVLPDYPEPLAGDPPTVREAIGDLASMNRDKIDGDAFVGDLGEPSDYAKKLRIGRRSSRLTGCLRTTHSSDVVKRFKATPQGGQDEVSQFFRLSWDGISPTIRAGTGPEHGSHTAPRPIHPRWPRCITVREAARLHSFPDRFVFSGTRWAGFRQIGNSVPPLLAIAVAAKVFSAAAGEQNGEGDRDSGTCSMIRGKGRL